MARDRWNKLVRYYIALRKQNWMFKEVACIQLQAYINIFMNKFIDLNWIIKLNITNLKNELLII